MSAKLSIHIRDFQYFMKSLSFYLAKLVTKVNDTKEMS